MMVDTLQKSEQVIVTILKVVSCWTYQLYYCTRLRSLVFFVIADKVKHPFKYLIIITFFSELLIFILCPVLSE